MDLPFRITIKTISTDSPREYIGTFRDADAAVFRLFVEAEQELGECEYVKANLPLKHTFTWSRDGGYSPVTLPPAGRVKEFLHCLRPFVLDDEETFVPRILALLGRCYEDGPLRVNFKAAKRAFLGRDSQDYYRFEVGDLLINSDEALKVWLNAFEYHRDLDKRAYLGDLTQGVPLDVMKLFFLDALRDKAQVICWVALFLRSALASSTTDHIVTIDQQSSV